MEHLSCDGWISNNYMESAEKQYTANIAVQGLVDQG